tara:strand:- start:19716 stop:20405 length:690 start_codon:yes stop_codon:yes gene_type:complete
MNHIKNIYNKKTDEWVHNKFIRYSLGEFTKELFTIKVGGKNIQIKAGFEYLDCMFDLFSKLIKQNVKLNGVVVSKQDITSDLEQAGAEIKKKTGKKHTITAELDANKFKQFVEKFNKYPLLLKLRSGDYVLNVKKSVPKPGKVLEKFLTAKFPKTDFDILVKEFLFDTKTDKFKNAEIKHTYVIDKIKVPKQYENNPAMARLKAVRIGKIIREITIDEKTTKSEIKMEV